MFVLLLLFGVCFLYGDVAPPEGFTSSELVLEEADGVIVDIYNFSDPTPGFTEQEAVFFYYFLQDDEMTANDIYLYQKALSSRK